MLSGVHTDLYRYLGGVVGSAACSFSVSLWGFGVLGGIAGWKDDLGDGWWGLG